VVIPVTGDLCKKRPHMTSCVEKILLEANCST